MTDYLHDLIQITPAYLITRLLWLSDRLADAAVWLALFVVVAYEMVAQVDKELR